MADDDVSMMVELLRMVRREMAAGFESVREAQSRTSETIEKLALDHEDTKQHVARLEQSAAKRRAGMRK